MRLLLAVLLLPACAPAPRRVDVISSAPSFRARILSIAGASGVDRAREPALMRSLAKRLGRRGWKASVLADTPGVPAARLGSELASDPRALAEAQAASGADAFVFVAVSAGWKAVEVQAIDARGGDVVLRAAARPRGSSFRGVESAAEAAAEALDALSGRRVPAGEAPSSDIPVP